MSNIVEVMEGIFEYNEVNLINGGDNLIILDLKDEPFTNKQLEDVLDALGLLQIISVRVEDDNRLVIDVSGIPARGMGVVQAKRIATLITYALSNLWVGIICPDSPLNHKTENNKGFLNEIEELLKKYPLYKK